MSKNTIMGRVHSIQSMGTLDGPGVRFVIFLKGCPLRCKCCHNPDTWDTEGAKEYFGREGGVTISGGEPLLQADFVRNVFELCHESGLNTCLDTSGCILNHKVRALLDVTDRVLLDIKYTTDALYRENVGCSIDTPMAFLDYLCEKNIPTTVRQVIIPTQNDSDESILSLKKIVDTHPNVDKVELLPFRKICQVKYDNMNIEFPFGNIPEPQKELMAHLNELIKR